METCKHGITEAFCAICSDPNYYFKQKQVQHHGTCISHPKSLFNRIKKLQEKSKKTATNHNKRYETSEMLFLVSELKTLKRSDVNDLFKLAKKLKRRYNAIDWWWKIVNDKNYVARMTTNVGESWHKDIKVIKSELAILGF